MPGICLRVCLLATYVKTTERIFTKIFPQMYVCTWKNWLNIGSNPPPDPGIYNRILQHCDIRHFSTIWLISPESGRISMKILSQMYPGFRIQTIFSLTDACRLWLLLWFVCARSSQTCYQWTLLHSADSTPSLFSRRWTRRQNCWWIFFADFEKQSDVWVCWVVYQLSAVLDM